MLAATTGSRQKAPAMATTTLACHEATFLDSAIQRRAWKVIKALENVTLVMDDLAGSSVVLKDMVCMCT